jgi:hypothetical protein
VQVLEQFIRQREPGHQVESCWYQSGVEVAKKGGERSLRQGFDKGYSGADTKFIDEGLKGWFVGTVTHDGEVRVKAIRGCVGHAPDGSVQAI